MSYQKESKCCKKKCGCTVKKDKCDKTQDCMCKPMCNCSPKCECGIKPPCVHPLIVKSLSNLSIMEGDDITLEIQASGSNLTYRWEKNNTPVDPMPPMPMPNPNPNPNPNPMPMPMPMTRGMDNLSPTDTLFIEKAKPEDSGVYTVFVSNECGEVSSSCTIKVIDMSPVNTVVDMPVTGEVESSFDINHVDFRKADVLFTNTTDVTFKIDKMDRFPDGVLRIPHVYGSYSLNVEQTFPSDMVKFDLTFSVPKNWFLKKNYIPETAKLNRYTGGAWVELDTVLIPELTDADYFYYRSSVPGFSFFGITATLYSNIANPNGTPKYFGPSPNWGLSPLPRGRLSSIEIISNGAGYVNPTIEILDFFYGRVANPATAHAVVVDGMILEVIIDSKGSGYSYPVMVVTDPNATEDVDLSGTIEPYDLDQISRIVIQSPGSGMDNTTGLSVSGGSGAVLSPVIINGQMVSVDILNPGSGYVNPVVTVTGAYTTLPTFSVELGGYGGGIRKFVDSVEDSSSFAAVPNTTRYPGCDYYQIGIVEFEHRFHSDLPPTRVRGYVQVDIEKATGNASYFNFANPVALYNVDGTPILFNNVQVMAATKPTYMGAAINATKGRPVRVKFYNLLQTNAKGKHILPVDTTMMGAGMNMKTGEMYPENRTTIHLHGNNSAWISDGTPHQWFTPELENTSQKKGVNVKDVPDMPSEDGSVTLYFTNNQSSRLLFYHDHAYGLTRLNFYLGEVTYYNITDDIEQDLVTGQNNTGVNPNNFQIPEAKILMIQDKTFVDKDAIGFQDNTWNWGTGKKDANGRLVELAPGKFDYRTGDLWYGHVYVPAQNPGSPDGLNAYGRWHYGPWFWPPPTSAEVQYLPKPNPDYDPANPYEPKLIPDIPDVSSIGEAFMDTMTVNGVAYPYMEVDATVHRFKILNGCADRFLNLQWYIEDPENPGEVKMVDASPNPEWPETWGMDGREGGVPDPNTRGPNSIQIANECGFLPHPVEIENNPVTWLLDPTMFAFGNVLDHALTLGTAERADIIVDFSDYAGKTLILYNDAPAAFPAQVGQYNYYTGCPDRLDAGGAPSTKLGFGPNIRTVMQIKVKPSIGAPVDSIEVINKGECYTKPTVSVVSANGAGSGATAETLCRVEGVSMRSLGTGYLNPTVTASPPPNGTTAILAPVVKNGKIVEIKVIDGGMGYLEAPLITITDNTGINASAYATVVVDAIVLTNGGSGYTIPPDVSVYDSVGVGSRCSATSYLQGGPNFDMNSLNDVFAKTANKAGIFELSHEPIIVPSADYGSAYNRTDLPVDTVPRQGDHYFTFTGLDGNSHTIYVEPKALQDEQGEVFDTWGRSMIMLGVEIPFTSPGNMNFVMYPYASPPVDIAKATFVDLSAPNSNDIIATQIATTESGTQLWRITHNGVDTHTVHIHLFNAQLLGRVAWDGVIIPPDQNELGFKETFRVNPLQHTYFILRPIVDSSIPFINQIPNTIRLMDETMPAGALLMPPVGGYADPNGDPVIAADGVEGIYNAPVNYGWEYVWHCHLLAHEEMDMMHAICVAIPPAKPTNLTLVKSNGNIVTISWQANSINATNYVLEYSVDGFVWLVLANVIPPTTSFVNQTNQNYYYRVKAQNVVGAVQLPNFPTATAESEYSEIAYTGPPAAPSNLSLINVTYNSMDLHWTNALFTSGVSIDISTAQNFSPNSTSSVTLNVVNGVPNTNSFTGLVEGVRYYFRIMAFNGAEASQYSEVISGTTIIRIPDTPANFKILSTTTQGNRITYNLTWSIDTSLNSIRSGFEIETSTQQNLSNPTVFAPNSSTATSYSYQTNTTAPRYFRIRAYRTFGNGNGTTYYSNYNVTNNDLPINYPHNLGP